MFTADAILIFYCLNFLNQCILKHVHLLDQPEARNKHSLATFLALGSHVFIHASAEAITAANLTKFPDTATSSTLAVAGTKHH